jgi:hypothetical protein
MALDPIVWRLGPAARGREILSDAAHGVRVGVFGGSMPAELRHTLERLETVHGSRVAIQVVGGGYCSWRFGKQLVIPSWRDESRLADWAFDNLRWDMAVIPVSANDAEREVRLLELAALRIPGITLGPDVARAREVVDQLVNDPASRARLARDAMATLETRQDLLDRDEAAARLLEAMLAIRARRDVPDLPESLRRFGGGFVPARYEDGFRPDLRPTAFPRPRSKMQRKLEKLRRDPAAFFKDSRMLPLRLLAGWFD